jgi:hypothetical protein
MTGRNESKKYNFNSSIREDYSKMGWEKNNNNIKYFFKEYNKKIKENNIKDKNKNYEDILEEEVLCFLSRVIKCNSKSLFILIFAIEPQINKNKIDYLFNKINEYINKKENESIFLILFSDKNKELIFENIKNYRPFEYNFNENELKEKIKNKFTDNKITIICSDICGAGKTEYIKSTVKNNENYVYFSLGGYLTEKEILNQIDDLITRNNNKIIIFHIDLSESIFENIIKEFFFKFLILKYYGYNDKIFCYDKNKIKIKIELPNSHIDYFNKYKILQYIKIEKKNYYS